MRAQHHSQVISISALARQFGLRPSALRYYEQVGLLRPVSRLNGQRYYAESAQQHLAVISMARRAGLSVDEIAELFFSFRSEIPAQRGWQELARRKLDELEQLKCEISKTQEVLRRLQSCNCVTIEMCGERLRGHIARNDVLPVRSLQPLRRKNPAKTRAKQP